MSHDQWRDQLHDAGADAVRLAALFRSGIPSDGLQLAGSAVLATAPSSDLTAVVGDLVAALGQRGWIGDTELAVALIDYAEQRASELIQIGVDLDDLADVIDQPPSSESYIDLESGVVWPGELFDLDQGPTTTTPTTLAGGCSCAGKAPRPRTATWSDSSQRLSPRRSAPGSDKQSPARHRSRRSSPRCNATTTSSRVGIATAMTPEWAERGTGSPSTATPLRI